MWATALSFDQAGMNRIMATNTGGQADALPHEQPDRIARAVRRHQPLEPRQVIVGERGRLSSTMNGASYSASFSMARPRLAASRARAAPEEMPNT